jgi:hypothetical protein
MCVCLHVCVCVYVCMSVFVHLRSNLRQDLVSPLLTLYLLDVEFEGVTPL